MTKEELLNLAFVNFDTLVKPVKGVVIDCHGFSDMSNFTSSPKYSADLGKNGIAYVFPYYGAWAWCSESTIEYMNLVLDEVFNQLSLDEKAPLVVSGGSMGGMTALMYSIYGSRKPVAVQCNCPVTDMHFYASDGGLRIRSIYCALLKKGEDFDISLSRIDPMLHVNDFAYIPYLIVGGEADMGITIDRYHVPFVDKMKGAGHNIKLLRVPGMGHCEIMAFENAYREYLNFAVNAICTANRI